MIKFSLVCEQDHAFESWFPDSQSYDEQSRRGLVTCPDCGVARVTKAPMAPAVFTRRKGEAAAPQIIDERMKAMRSAMTALRREIETRTEDVGEAFPQVARAIHSGEEEVRAVRGQASLAEVKSLVEEGVPVAPVPMLPDEVN